MIDSLLRYGPVVLLWVAVAYKLPAFRRSPRDPAVRAYWLTLLSLALALTALLPPVYVAIDRLAGVPNLTRLLANSLALVTAWTVQAFLFYLSEPEALARRAVRRRGLTLVGTLALMAGLFIAAPVDQEAVNFTRRYGDVPFILEYRLVFLAYLAVAAANVARLSWRYAAIADRPSLRLGLRLVAAGGLVSLAYVIHEGLYVMSRRLDVTYLVSRPEIVTLILVAVASSLMVIGSTMPAWGPHLGIPRVCRWVGHYRSLRRLYPLWRDLYRASPEIALLPPPSRLTDVLTMHDLGFRLYRRAVEIRDGRLALRPYLEPGIANTACQLCHEAGLDDEEIQAVVEATCLAVAMHAKASGRVPAGIVPTPAPPGGSDLTSEVAVLERVARCYVSSPVVAAVLTRLEHAEDARVDNIDRIAGEWR